METERTAAEHGRDIPFKLLLNLLLSPHHTNILVHQLLFLSIRIIHDRNSVIHDHKSSFSPYRDNSGRRQLESKSLTGSLPFSYSYEVLSEDFSCEVDGQKRFSFVAESEAAVSDCKNIRNYLSLPQVCHGVLVDDLHAFVHIDLFSSWMHTLGELIF